MVSNVADPFADPFHATIAMAAWFARKATEEDAPALQMLFESDPHYFDLVQGVPPGPAEAQSTFTILPDGKTYDDKFVLILTDTPRSVVGVIDIIRDYPAPRQWFLGLLFIDPSRRSQGHGRRIIEDLIEHVRGYGVRQLRIAVVERNESALRFWVRSGFDEERRFQRKIQTGRELSTLVMVKNI